MARISEVAVVAFDSTAQWCVRTLFVYPHLNFCCFCKSRKTCNITTTAAILWLPLVEVYCMPYLFV